VTPTGLARPCRVCPAAAPPPATAPFPARRLALALLLAAGTLGWLGWHAVAIPARLDELGAQQVRVVPLAARTDSANTRLVAAEHRAFALARAGQPDSARALLDGAAYARDKRLFAEGMATFVDSLAGRRLAASAAERRRSEAATAAALLGIAAAVAALGAGAGAVRGWRATLEARAVERTASLEAANDALAASLVQREAADRRFRAIFERSAVGISIVDDDGHLLAVNQAFAEFVGRPVGELIGRVAATLSPPDDGAVTRQPVHDIRAGVRDAVTVEKRFLTPTAPSAGGCSPSRASTPARASASWGWCRTSPTAAASRPNSRTAPSTTRSPAWPTARCSPTASPTPSPAPAASPRRRPCSTSTSTTSRA
jgi:PAS domain-containing protein